MTASSLDAVEQSPLSIVLSPQGHLRVDMSPDAKLAPPLAEIADQFARGDGYGVFRLGAAEAETPLPSVLSFWRDVGRAFVVRLCTTENLEELRERFMSRFPRTSWPGWPRRRRRCRARSI